MERPFRSMGSAVKQQGIVERRTKVCGIVSGAGAARLTYKQRLDMALPRSKQRRTIRCRHGKPKGTVLAQVLVHDRIRSL